MELVQDRQKRIYANKLAHNFNVTDLNIELECLMEEVREFKEAINKNDVDNMIEELSDIVIFCYGMAEIIKRDLDKEIETKMGINEKRIYKQDANGKFIKIGLIEGDK